MIEKFNYKLSHDFIQSAIEFTIVQDDWSHYSGECPIPRWNGFELLSTLSSRESNEFLKKSLFIF